MVKLLQWQSYYNGTAIVIVKLVQW